MGKLDGKVAIITGGARGMGYGCAKVMAKYGAKVALFDYSDNVFETAVSLEKEGYQAIAFKVDVRDMASVKEAVKKTAGHYGKIDILANVAGIAIAKNFLEFDDESRDAVIGVNFFGCWNCCQAIIPYMLENKYGKIVIFSSVTGNTVCDPGMTAYGSSKGAVLGLTKTLASEFASRNISVNAILPGFVDTPMMRNLCAEMCPENPQSVVDAIAANIPTHELGTIEEAGEIASFLVSDESKYITGTSIIFDGGSGLPETPCSCW